MGNLNNKKKNIKKKENNKENNIQNNSQNTENILNSEFSYIYFLKDLTTQSFCKYWNDNTFTLFKSYYDIIYLIYANKSNSIISLDLISNKKINEIKHAHNDYITSFRHYFDKNSKRDLLISLSLDDNNLKLWNINSLECLINIKKVNKVGFLTSACFLEDNNSIYIITSNKKNNILIENIKIFDLNGNKIKEIKDSNNSTVFIDTYYDIKLSKNFIITGNEGFSQSYDYNKNKKYFKYIEKKMIIHI